MSAKRCRTLRFAGRSVYAARTRSRTLLRSPRWAANRKISRIASVESDPCPGVKEMSKMVGNNEEDTEDGVLLAAEDG